MDLIALTPSVVQSYAVLTVIAFVLSLVTAYVLAKNSHNNFFLRHGLWFMFVTSLLATLGSLFFSDIAGWNPCKDCWLQRIVMYPQVVLLLVALFRKDKGIAPYILALSLIGLVLSGEHYYEQVQAALQPPSDPLVPCDTTGVSCAATQIHFTFGFITIPVMAFSVFLLNALIATKMMRKNTL
jgi:disulfide bond formation protein DsbB